MKREKRDFLFCNKATIKARADIQVEVKSKDQQAQNKKRLLLTF